MPDTNDLRLELAARASMDADVLDQSAARIMTTDFYLALDMSNIAIRLRAFAERERANHRVIEEYERGSQ